MKSKELNLYKILKNCQKGTKLYSPLFGKVELDNVNIDLIYPIKIKTRFDKVFYFSNTGKLAIDTFKYIDSNECMLFPSIDNRDWSTFKLKVERFNPKTFEPFDKVLVREGDEDCWIPTFISYFDRWLKKIITVSDQAYSRVIPYNDDTKHLIGACDEAPEYYRYWEN